MFVWLSAFMNEWCWTLTVKIKQPIITSCSAFDFRLLQLVPLGSFLCVQQVIMFIMLTFLKTQNGFHVLTLMESFKNRLKNASLRHRKAGFSGSAHLVFVSVKIICNPSSGALSYMWQSWCGVFSASARTVVKHWGICLCFKEKSLLCFCLK